MKFSPALGISGCRLSLSLCYLFLLSAPLCSLAQPDTGALSEATLFASSLASVTQDLLAVPASATELGALPKTLTELDVQSATDESLAGIRTFLQSITRTMEQQRDTVEATYLQPSSREPCLNPNIADPAAVFSAPHGFEVAKEHCELKTPGSEATLSQPFADWIPTLFETLATDSSVVWQYFGDASSGNYASTPFSFWSGFDYDPRERPWYTSSAS